MWRKVTSTDFPLGEWEWDDGARFRSDACQAYCDRQEEARERARRAGFSSVHSYREEMWQRELDAWNRSPEARAMAREVEQADARHAAERERVAAEREALAAAQAEECARAQVAARETLDRLGPIRAAAIDEVWRKRRTALAAVSEWQLRDVKRRAAERLYRRDDGYADSREMHVAYLHLIEGRDLQHAVEIVNQSPPDAWLNPVPMCDEERKARKILGLPCQIW